MNAPRRPDASQLIADHITGFQFEQLGVDDIAATKRLLVDTFATTIGGSNEPPVRELLRYYSDEAGKTEATVMVHGLRLPARNAVTINSAMARALDLDDAHEIAIVHTGVHVVPAALAIAERQGSISGRDLISAIALGQDLMCRLSMACETPPILRGRPGTYLFGTFATAAVTARLLGLDARGVVDALGNAYTRSAGTTLGYQAGALAQRLLQGLSASDGVLAGLMAAQGIGGIDNCLEGDAGYFAIHEAGRYDRSVLVDALGATLHGTTTSLKRHPVHRGAILDIEVALAAAGRESFAPDKVVRVVVRYPSRFRQGHERIGAFLADRADPKGPVEPHFSNLWAVGVALAIGKVRIDDFTEAGVARLRDRVVPIARLVEGVPDDELDKECDGLGPRSIEVTMSDGTVIVERIEHGTGDPRSPLGWDELRSKLEDCASLAARPIPVTSLRHLMSLIEELEELDDVGVLPAIVTGQTA